MSGIKLELSFLKLLGMPTYLIEIPHSSNTSECNQIVKLFLESGSHLLSNADWGCKDGVHKAWFKAEFDNKEQAMQIIPSFLRHHATIVEIIKFKQSDMGDLVQYG